MCQADVLPRQGLLEIELGKPKEELSGNKSYQVGPWGVQMRLKEASVGKLERRVKPQVRSRQDDL